ncbi:globin [Microlunatus soli]|uniref:Hemoglobin n=1 Tax=Microlunatus soli TaxID=630515 RepID=A0A1H1Y3B0_9ACTN|nr:globin [Microlunatus soli]SDT15897.1 hemoglobin [Microlunatus soli]
MSSHEPSTQTFYEQFGGAPVFEKLVHHFYLGVADDPELRALYPEEDLGPAEVRLRMFLEQYWGGPTTYSEQRGHPRLRMRHLPFAVTPDMRDRWLQHMRAALDEVALPAEQDQIFWDYLSRAAYAMVNTFDETGSPDQPAPGLGITPRPS